MLSDSKKMSNKEISQVLANFLAKKYPAGEPEAYSKIYEYCKDCDSTTRTDLELRCMSCGGSKAFKIGSSKTSF